MISYEYDYRFRDYKTLYIAGNMMSAGDVSDEIILGK